MKALVVGSEKGDWRSKMRCFKCHQVGHPKRECPLLGGESEGAKKSGALTLSTGSGAKKPKTGMPSKPIPVPKKGTTFKGVPPKKRVRFDGVDEEDLSEESVGDKSFKSYVASSASSVALLSVGNGTARDSHISFVVDTGATHHMITSEKYLSEFTFSESSVRVAGGMLLRAIGTGNLRCSALDQDGNLWPIILSDVLCVPDLKVNLLSVEQLMQNGAEVSFKRYYPHIRIGRKKSFFSGRKDGLQMWQLKPDRVCAVEYPTALVTTVSAELLHKRLGHRSLDLLRGAEGLDIKITGDLHHDGKCVVCELSKHTHISFPKEIVRKAERPFEIVHVDFVGPIEEPSLSGARYGVIFTDEKTRYVSIYCVEFKSEFLSCLKRYLLDVKALGHKVKTLWGRSEGFPKDFWDTGKRVEGIRTDHGGEFVGEDVRTYCKNVGIKQTFSGPYAPQQQGISERKNRTLFEMVRSMLYQSKLGKEFWGEALNTAAYLVNRMPSADRVSPYEALYGKPPTMANLRTFGCKAYVQYPKGSIQKLDPRSWEGIMLGYAELNWRCYRIYDPKTFTVKPAIHVTFDEVIWVMSEGSELHLSCSSL